MFFKFPNSFLLALNCFSPNLLIQDMQFCWDFWKSYVFRIPSYYRRNQNHDSNSIQMILLFASLLEYQ
jgi:hypothetical protein